MRELHLFAGIGGGIGYPIPALYHACMVNKNTMTPVASDVELRRLYVTDGMTQQEIADVFNVSLKKIQGDLRRAGIKMRKAAKRDQFGAKNHQWRDAAELAETRRGRIALHKRLYHRRGSPKLCEHCGTTTARSYDWANMTGAYEDPSDYKRLCRSCHWRYDEKHRNFKGGASGSHA